jgi:hypothetical protein
MKPMASTRGPHGEVRRFRTDRALARSRAQAAPKTLNARIRPLTCFARSAIIETRPVKLVIVLACWQGMNEARSISLRSGPSVCTRPTYRVPWQRFTVATEHPGPVRLHLGLNLTINHGLSAFRTADTIIVAGSSPASPSSANALDRFAVITATTTTDQPGPEGRRVLVPLGLPCDESPSRCAQEHSPDAGNPNPAYHRWCVVRFIVWRSCVCSRSATSLLGA